MAIKIDSAGSIKKITPSDGMYFNVDMLERIIGGWPEPNKIGPVWVIKNEDVEKSADNFNQIASMFFQSPIYGDVLSLSALELPPEWDLVDDLDRKFTIDEMDEGFLKSLTDIALTDSTYDPEEGIDWEASLDPFSINGEKDYMDNFPKSEYFYNPRKPKHPETEVENFNKFLQDAYSHIVTSYEEGFKDFVVYEDKQNVVKVVTQDDRILTINQVMDELIKEEDYEKCAVLRDILQEEFHCE